MSRARLASRLALLVLGCTVLACTVLGCAPEIPDDTFACTTSNDCPTAFFCVAGFCSRSQSEPDASDRDGGVDAGPDAGIDGGPRDGGPDDGGDGGLMDGGPPDGGGSPCGPLAPPGSIVGCATTTYVRVDGARVTEPRDMSRYTVAAYIVDDDAPSGFQIRNGTSTAGGIVRVDGIPEETPYYLRLHDPDDAQYPNPNYFFTRARDLDLGDVRRGRDDTPVTLVTPVSVNLTGLTEWRPSDDVSFESFNNGTQHGSIPLEAGATTYDETLDWQYAYGEVTFSDMFDYARRAQLVDAASRGDDLWIVHSRPSYVGIGAHAPLVTTAIDFFTTTDVTMSNGESTTIEGAFSPAPPGSTQQLTVNLGAARAAFRDGDRYDTENIWCWRYANPAASDGLGGGQLISIRVDLNPTETFVNVTAPYNNPYPASWASTMRCRMERVRVSMVEGRFRSDYSYLFSHTGASDTFTWNVATRAPANVRIAGQDALAGGAVPFDGVTPVTMTWDAVPGVGRYSVRVIGSAEGLTAKFDTSETSLTMPADTFTRGDFYVFRVYAIQTSADYAGGRLASFEMPLHVARLATAWFRFSDACGDGVVDEDEECDPGSGVDTDTCDRDCTFVSCGDGHVNSAAGEACDAMMDGHHCDSICQRPVCGDGHWNPTVEGCDDGNIEGGDGCAALCHLERCGDGTIDPFEECDDGNRENGDGCDAACRNGLTL